MNKPDHLRDELMDQIKLMGEACQSAYREGYRHGHRTGLLEGFTRAKALIDGWIEESGHRAQAPLPEAAARAGSGDLPETDHGEGAEKDGLGRA